MAASTIGLRERKNERTRNAITKATLELTQQLGFEHATIVQIADRADVSPRTFHAWFSSKEDVIVGGSEQLRERLAGVLGDGDGDVLDRLHRWLELEGELRTEPDDISRLRHKVILSDPHLRAVQRARLQDVEDVIASAIAKDANLPADAVAPRALAAAMATTLLALQERFVDGGSSEVHFDGVEQMLRAALGALDKRD